MSDHTPGPWRIWDAHLGPNGDRMGIVSGETASLAEVLSDYGRLPRDANARLIAAAPRLLAVAKSALVELVACLDELGEPDSEIPARLREVIFEATGEKLVHVQYGVPEGEQP